MPDDLTAALDEIRERHAPGRYIRSAHDVPRLLAAVDEVLKLHARQEQPMRSYDLDLRCEAHNWTKASIGAWTKASIGAFGAVRDCPDCTYRERHPCTHCREEDWPCPTVQAVSSALLGEAAGDG